MPSPETLKALGVAGLLVMQNVHLAYLRRQVQELKKQAHTHEGAPAEEPAREGESREKQEGQRVPEPAPA